QLGEGGAARADPHPRRDLEGRPAAARRDERQRRHRHRPQADAGRPLPQPLREPTGRLVSGAAVTPGVGDSAAPNRAALTICVMLATIMQALDMTIANVALPYMQGSLSATLDQISWVL